MPKSNVVSRSIVDLAAMQSAGQFTLTQFPGADVSKVQVGSAFIFRSMSPTHDANLSLRTISSVKAVPNKQWGNKPTNGTQVRVAFVREKDAPEFNLDARNLVPAAALKDKGELLIQAHGWLHGVLLAGLEEHPDTANFMVRAWMSLHGAGAKNPVAPTATEDTNVPF